MAAERVKIIKTDMSEEYITKLKELVAAVFDKHKEKATGMDVPNTDYDECLACQ